MTGWDEDIVSNQAYTTTNYTYFDEYYFYQPLSYINKNHILDTGNKIIMPQSALEKLLSSHYDNLNNSPMLFQIENTTTGKHSHCGVMEFTAEEGFVYMPTWMRKNLQLQEGDMVNIRNICLPKGTFIKIQPHTTKFTTLSDHKSILENSFRDFACLTTGDTICINHGEDKYMIDIVETKPEWGVSLYETDCEVDFLPPLDYKEPEKKRFSDVAESLKKLKITESTKMINDEKVKSKDSTEFRAFVGVGRRVDGHASLAVVTEEKVAYDHQTDTHEVSMKKGDEGFKPFTGRSFRLV